MQLVRLVIAVEPKDEWAKGAGFVPGNDAIARHAQEALRDETKNDFDLPYKIVDVQAAL